MRITQTHTGDNIPNGSYTEPMEAGIKERGGTVVFSEGCFMIEGDDFSSSPYPLFWAETIWDLDSIKDAISYGGNADRFTFDDPEEGDLQYLIEECKLKTVEEFLNHINGLEIIGNIYENKNLIE